MSESEQLDHERKDDIVEFARANIAYRVGDNGYVAEVLVGTRKNGAAVLYDIVNIVEKEITEAPVTMVGESHPQRRQSTPVGSMVSQEHQQVKRGNIIRTRTTSDEVAQFNAKTGMKATVEEFEQAGVELAQDQAELEVAYAEREAGGIDYTPPTAKDVKAYSTADTEVYSKALSRTVYMYDGASHAQAEAGFAENGVVYINKNALVDRNSVAVVLAHEYTHTIEGTEEYSELMQAVFQSEGYQRMLMSAGHGSTLSITHEEHLQQIIDRYAAVGVAVDEAGAQKEAVAKYLSEYVFQNERHLIELARANPSWFQKAYTAIRRFIARLFGRRPTDADLKKLERLFAKAAKAANTAPQTQKSPATESGVQYSVQYQNANVNDQVLSLIEKVKRGEYKANDYVSFGAISDEVATYIFEATGIDVRGFDLRVEARQIYHILKDHGENGISDHSMKNDVDIAKMEFILESPDSIVPAGKTQAYSYMRDGYNRTAETVLYEKEIGGGQSYYVVQALPITKRKAVYVVSAFIGNEGYKKETPQLTNAQSPSATSEIGSAEVSNNSIPDSSEKSNTQFSIPTRDLSSEVKPPKVPKDRKLTKSEYLEKVLSDPAIVEATKAEIRAANPLYEVMSDNERFELAQDILRDDDRLTAITAKLQNGEAITAEEITALIMIQNVSAEGEEQADAAFIVATAGRLAGRALRSFNRHLRPYAEMEASERYRALLADTKADATHDAFKVQNEFIDYKLHKGAGDYIDQVVIKFHAERGLKALSAEKLGEKTIG